VTYHLNESATVTLTLRDRVGRLIRLLSRQHTSPEGDPVEHASDNPFGPRRLQHGRPISERVPWALVTGSWHVWENMKTINWRPVDRAGRALPQGIYRIRLVAVDAHGSEVRRDWTITIDAGRPRVHVIRGGALAPDDSLVIAVNDRHSGLCITEPHCGTSFRIDGKKQHPRMRQGRWMYRPANGWTPESRHQWALRACDRAGNCTRARGDVDGIADRPRR
jgi:hypothetical protein